MKPCPFIGLRYFEESDREYFFGRESDCALLAANAMGSPITVIYAPSGSGKSSLIRAGLTPFLREKFHAEVIIESDWNKGVPETLRPTTTRKSTSVDPHRRIFVLDQFEDVFREDHEAALMHELGERLAKLLEQEDAPTSVVLSLREDALASLEKLRPYLPGVFDNLIQLSPLSEDGARQALQRPLSRIGSAIDHRLTEAVLEACRQGETIQLPYLQLLGTKLWQKAEERGQSSSLGLELLAELGGGQAIFLEHVRSCLGPFDEKQKRVIAIVFDRVVSESGGKLPHSLAELASKAGVPAEEIEELLERLCDESTRLLSPIISTNGVKKYQLFHDVLSGPVLDWTRKRQDADRQSVLRRKVLIATAAIALGIILVIVSIYQFREAESQRNEAQAAWQMAETTTNNAKLALEELLASLKRQQETEKAVTDLIREARTFPESVRKKVSALAVARQRPEVGAAIEALGTVSASEATLTQQGTGTKISDASLKLKDIKEIYEQIKNKRKPRSNDAH